MVALAKSWSLMTVAEFLDWSRDGPERWELVDGVPRALAPPNNTHGEVHAQLARLIGNHLAAKRPNCRALIGPGVVPATLSAINMRVPDIVVTCTPDATPRQRGVTHPVLLAEILSPSNQPDTWSNVSAYTSMPSAAEILVLRTDAIGAHLLRRRADGSWPGLPDLIEDGDLALTSIGFAAPLADLYATSALARPPTV